MGKWKNFPNIFHMGGFSLAELLFSLFLFSVISTFVFLFYTKFFHIYTFEKDLTHLHQEALFTLDRMSKDIQLLGVEPKRPIFFPRNGIQGLNESLFVDSDQNHVADQILIVGDFNGNGEVDEEREKIIYRVDESGNLLRNQRIIMENVLQLRFQFLDEVGQIMSLEEIKANLPKSKESLITLVKIVLHAKPKSMNPKTNDFDHLHFMTMSRILNR